MPRMKSSSKPWEHSKSSGSEGDPLAARFVASLDVDWRLYKHDIAGSIAHARMLQSVGLITEHDLSEIERGLGEIEAEIEALGANGRQWSGFKIELEDVHMCVEAALIEKVGEPGRKLHTGRSRNDQVALDIRLWLSDAIRIVYEKTQSVERAFLAIAQRDGHILLPSYTHLQRAQPVVVGGELVAWMNALDNAKDRLAVLDRQNEVMPLGSGAVAGSSLSLDSPHVAGGLDLEVPIPSVPRSSIELTASRDSAVDFVFACAMLSQWLSRWAEQWILYASTEFGFISLDDRYTTGSSMMPQKQNPDMLELIRGKCGGVYGNLIALLTMLKGLPIGYNRDLQEDKKHVFDAYDTVCDCLDMAAHIVETTKFNEDKIKAGLDRGFLDATSLAEYLVTKGVAFRTSHQIVGSLVRLCQTTDRYKLAQLSLDEMNEAAAETNPANQSVITEDVYEWLGPENVVKRYQSAGNSGLTGFEQQLAAWKERLQHD